MTGLFYWQSPIKQKEQNRNCLPFFDSTVIRLWGEWESNPHDCSGRRILSPLRLPIPPSPHCTRVYLEYILPSLSDWSRGIASPDKAPGKHAAQDGAHVDGQVMPGRGIEQHLGRGRKVFITLPVDDR